MHSYRRRKNGCSIFRCMDSILWDICATLYDIYTQRECLHVKRTPRESQVNYRKAIASRSRDTNKFPVFVVNFSLYFIHSIVQLDLQRPLHTGLIVNSRTGHRRATKRVGRRWRCRVNSMFVRYILLSFIFIIWHRSRHGKKKERERAREVALMRRAIEAMIVL